jgi:RNA polymerase sigma-70 factor (ECF subfamily)
MGDELVSLCGATVRELVAQMRTSHPTLDLSDDDFVAALAAHTPRDDAEASCKRVRVDEFALAAAAARGRDAAIAQLERTFSATLGAACRRFEGRGHTADDLRQILRTKLFVGDEPAIALYNGQGSLETWLRVIATRLFIDLGRRKDRARETSEDPSDLDVIEPSDLALDLVKAEYRSAVAAALDEAARQLDAVDRHLLRQHLVAGLSIDQVGAVLGIHRATAARRIAKAREQLAAKTRELVAAQLQLDERELAELFGLVVSKLDVSLRQLLASRPS